MYLYPKHNRVPNKIVRKLYSVGYFIGDFVPLILNMIDGVYWAIRRLVAFIVGLLVDSSIFVVIIGSIIFSVTHSVRQLRSVGATNGLEYVGVLMFEVIYIGASATLTSFLVTKRKPAGFIEWMGLFFTLLGFAVGLLFVWWSNVKGMADTWEGRIIGSMVPVLVLISEGILAFRYISELQHDTTEGDTNNHDNSNQHNTMVTNNNDNGNDDSDQQEKTDKDNKTANTDADNQQGRNTTNANSNDNTSVVAKHNNDVTPTKVVNIERKQRKRRELDPDTVLAIFQAKGSNAHIGKQFGVSAETVRKIKNGERHANVTAPYRQRQAK